MATKTYLLISWTLLYLGVGLQLIQDSAAMEDFIPGQVNTVPYLSVVVSNSYQCQRLCVVSEPCQGVDFNVQDRVCNLYSSQLLDSAELQDAEGPHSGSQVIHLLKEHMKDTRCVGGACGHALCGKGDLCVATGQGYLGLPVADCGSPSQLATLHYSKTTPMTSMGTEVTYDCALGYNVTDGHGVTVCQSNGIWSEHSLQCQIVVCDEPPQLPNMVVGPMTTKNFNSTILYSCDLGYRVKGGEGLGICQERGTWSTPTLDCKLVVCDVPPQLPNMKLGSVTSRNFSSTIIYSCNLGYKLKEGEGKSKCEQTGNWSLPTLVCEIVVCDEPPQLPNMELESVASMNFNSTILYGCNLGYKLKKGGGLSICQETEKWSSPSLECEIVVCDDPPQLPNMELGYMTSRNFNSTIIYSCVLGYKVKAGNGDVKCEQSGNWSTPTLACEPISNLITDAALSTGPSQLTCTTREITAFDTPQSCQDGEVLADCSATGLQTSPEKGVEIIKANSTAYCKVRYTGTAVQASVRCCKMDKMQCEYLYNGPSQARDDAQAIVTCYKDFTVLGCSVYNLGGGSIDGATVSKTTCIGVNGGGSVTGGVNLDCVSVLNTTFTGFNGGDGGEGVYAHGVCCSAPGLSCHALESTPVIVQGEMMATCPDGQVMTGCSGLNYWKSAHGSYITDDANKSTCHVVVDGHNEHRSSVHITCCEI